jgi:ABC-type Na+ transport system ATPase subunit NatA
VIFLSEVSKLIQHIIAEDALKKNMTEVKFSVSLDETHNRMLELTAKSLGMKKKKVPFARALIIAGLKEAMKELDLMNNDEFKEYLFSDKPTSEFTFTFLENQNEEE